jgi:hypothetical protein
MPKAYGVPEKGAIAGCGIAVALSSRSRTSKEAVMRALLVLAAIAISPIGQAFAWGPEGHSIVAEIAQRRLGPDARQAIADLFARAGIPNASLGSMASFADDYREGHPVTGAWHFVDIPIASDAFDPATQCPQGNCVIAQLERLKTQLRCAADDQDKLDALRLAVHFVGDVHQPLHTVAEERGGNGIRVDVNMRGLTCRGLCVPDHVDTNLHAAWDVTLITKTVWDWGAYVDRLEAGWLKGPEATGADAGAPLDWALETHRAAQAIWPLTPASKVLDDAYYGQALPILDRQLGRAGLRLARYLNDAYAPDACGGK